MSTIILTPLLWSALAEITSPLSQPFLPLFSLSPPYQQSEQCNASNGLPYENPIVTALNIKISDLFTFVVSKTD
jgi:hypothetical protein